MRRQLFTTGLVSLTTIVGLYGTAETASNRILLENEKVRVVERLIPPDGVRGRHEREFDQVIVFIIDCTYERVDPETGEKTVRHRQAGDTIWHSKGEQAPELINRSGKTMHSIIVNLK